jgi:hypothetical protein
MNKTLNNVNSKSLFLCYAILNFSLRITQIQFQNPISLGFQNILSLEILL